MKSHQWKQVACHGVLKYCLRGLLANKQQHTLFVLLDTLTRLCAEEISCEEVQDLESEVHEVLSMVERDFPLSLQVIVVHLLHHLPYFIKRFGPVYSFWMYPFERFNSWICRRIMSRRYPEACVVDTYRLSEWAHFMELSKQLPSDADAKITPASSLLNTAPMECASPAEGEIVLTKEQLFMIADYYSKHHQVIFTFADLPDTALKLKHHIVRSPTGRLVHGERH